jgi:hypothetical protein
VSAAGYNSYHELITTGVPTIFIPNLETATDDQAARARFAAERRAGLALFDPEAPEVDAAVDAILDPARRAAMAERCHELSLPGGASEAMQAIADVAKAAAPHTTRVAAVPTRSRPAGPPTGRGVGVRRAVAAVVRLLKSLYGALPERVKRLLRPLVRAAPTSLTRRGTRSSWHGDRPVVLFVLLALHDEVDAAVDEVARLRVVTAAFEPLFVTSARDLAPFRRHGFAIEFVPPPIGRWAGGDADDWRSHVRDRLRTIVAAHRPIHTVTVQPDGQPLRESWLAELLISLRTT